MITTEIILAGLKKVGPCSPGVLADHLQVVQGSLSYHLKKMLTAGTIKATGESTARRLALPDQKFEEQAERTAPPQGRKKPKHKKAKHARKAPRRAAPAASAAELFLPTVDADSRLVIVNGSAPQIFNEKQTEAIATLLFQHYKD